MAFIPYLHFNGTCRAALNFYAEAFDTAPPLLSLFSEAPPDFAEPEIGDLIMHGELRTRSGAVIYASDLPPSMHSDRVNANVYYGTPSETEARAVFAKLSEGGKIWMQIGPNFFASLFGGVTDRFGVSWMISHDPD